MLPWFIQSAFAGLGAMIWHWGIGVGVIICILAAEYFLAAVPFVERFSKDLLWVAVAIALVLAGEFVGARDMANRCAAQAEVVNEQVGAAVEDATAKPGRTDRWTTDE